MIWSIALFAVMSLVCAFAWDYNSLLVFRTIQGIGLGGEVPVAAVFISELAKAKGRGRFVLLYELVFPIGLVSASLVGLWVVPHLGWQIHVRHRRTAGIPGAGAALAAAGIAALAGGARPQRRGRSRHGADREGNAEGDRPAAAAAATGRVHLGQAALRCRDLFGPLYLRRTLVVWVIWFSAYFVNYGLSIWLPTVYRTVFQLPLDVSLRYGLITQAVGLIGTLICALDHRLCRAAACGLRCRSPLRRSRWRRCRCIPNPTAEQVLTCMTIAYFFVSTINIGVYLYTPELYPTRVRALGVGTATAWLRFASMIGPTVVGMMIACAACPRYSGPPRSSWLRSGRRDLPP